MNFSIMFFFYNIKYYKIISIKFNKRIDSFADKIFAFSFKPNDEILTYFRLDIIEKASSKFSPKPRVRFITR